MASSCFPAEECPGWHRTDTMRSPVEDGARPSHPFVQLSASARAIRHGPLHGRLWRTSGDHGWHCATTVALVCVPLHPRTARCCISDSCNSLSSRSGRMERTPPTRTGHTTYHGPVKRDRHGLTGKDRFEEVFLTTAEREIVLFRCQYTSEAMAAGL